MSRGDVATTSRRPEFTHTHTHTHAHTHTHTHTHTRTHTFLLVYNLDDSTHVSLLYNSIGVNLLMIVILAVVSSTFLQYIWKSHHLYYLVHLLCCVWMSLLLMNTTMEYI